MITVKSKLKVICANDEALEIMKKHIPGFDPNDPTTKQGANMSLKAISNFPQAGMSKETLAAIEADFQAAQIEED